MRTKTGFVSAIIAILFVILAVVSGFLNFKGIIVFLMIAAAASIVSIVAEAWYRRRWHIN